MSKHWDGKRSKIRGSHSTFTDFATEVVSIIEKLDEVEGISAGIMKPVKGGAGGRKTVKIAEYQGGLVLTVRQVRSIQELRIFASDIPKARLAIARALRDRVIPITFKNG